MVRWDVGYAVQVVESADEYRGAVEKEDETVVSYITASWCGPCKMIAPVYEALSETHDDMTFLKVDVDELPEVAGSEGVEAVPTFVFYKHGMRLGQMSGADKDAITSAVDKLKNFDTSQVEE